jgi:Holliday junction resolvase RusA-like endonuclease
MDLTIEVYGIPETQGSTRSFVRGGRAVTTSDNSKLRPWRDTVTNATRDAVERRGWRRSSAAVRVDVTFWLPRPASAPRTRDVWPAKGKDVDKMLRAINDSLTNAGAIVDDAQVCRGEFSKYYVVGPDLPKIYDPDFHRAAPGAVITVRELPLAPSPGKEP